MRAVHIQLLQLTHVQHPTHSTSELIAGMDDMNLSQRHTEVFNISHRACELSQPWIPTVYMMSE